jgi:hypothetical protein
MLVPNEDRSIDEESVASAQRVDEACFEGLARVARVAGDMIALPRSGRDQALHDPARDGGRDQNRPERRLARR